MKILIVGQGIAGTMLAWRLQQHGLRPIVADMDLPGASTPAAAGIINPVTGKRFVKSWRFDEFFPHAQSAYQAIESELGIRLWEARPILRLLPAAADANDWSIRCAQTDYAGLLAEATDAGAWQPFLKPGFRFGLIRQAARVNLPLLIAAFREKLRREGNYLEEKIEATAALNTYDRVVFCEGWQGLGNPFFPDTPFQLSKGEALRIRFNTAEALPTQMLKKTLTIVPEGAGVFWAGSPYQWDFQDGKPSEAGRAFLEAQLGDMLSAPYKIVGHVAGIRPTMKARRPVLAQSRIQPRFFIFNGLGTKGALLAPYFAHQLANALLGLQTEVELLPQ